MVAQLISLLHTYLLIHTSQVLIMSTRYPAYTAINVIRIHPMMHVFSYMYVFGNRPVSAVTTLFQNLGFS